MEAELHLQDEQSCLPDTLRRRYHRLPTLISNIIDIIRRAGLKVSILYVHVFYFSVISGLFSNISHVTLCEFCCNYFIETVV